MPWNGNRTLLCSQEARLRDVLPDAIVAREAVELIEHDGFDIVVIDVCTQLDTVHALRSIVGSRRRTLFVVQISDRVTTGDGAQAWRESVDLVVHLDDLDRMPDLIAAGRAEKRRIYERFHALAAQQGDV